MGSNCYRSRCFGAAAEPSWRLDVCPDKTCQNKPVPFWQVLGLPGAGGFDVDALTGYGMGKGYAVGMEHEATVPSSKLIADPLSPPLPSSLIISTLLYSEKILVWMISYKVTPPNLRPICCLDCFFLSSNLSFGRLVNYMYFFSMC